MSGEQGECPEIGEGDWGLGEGRLRGGMGWGRAIGVSVCSSCWRLKVSLATDLELSSCVLQTFWFVCW